MSKTIHKIGEPVLVIKGSTLRESLKVYGSNRERRDPEYREAAIEASHQRSKEWRSRQKKKNRAKGGFSGEKFHKAA